MERLKVDVTATGKPVKHGTIGAYTNHGCRCLLCTIAKRDHHREYLHRTGRRTPWDEYQATRERGDHGTQGRYKSGCRCDLCMEGMRSHRQRFRKAARQRPIPEHVHGTLNGYTNYACRCDQCRGAYRAAYEAKKASA